MKENGARWAAARYWSGGKNAAQRKRQSHAQGRGVPPVRERRTGGGRAWGRHTRGHGASPRPAWLTPGQNGNAHSTAQRRGDVQVEERVCCKQYTTECIAPPPPRAVDNKQTHGGHYVQAHALQQRAVLRPTGERDGDAAAARQELHVRAVRGHAHKHAARELGGERLVVRDARGGQVTLPDRKRVVREPKSRSEGTF